MAPRIDHYNFAADYEKDWASFLSQFPSDAILAQTPAALQAKQCCLDLHALIQTLYQSDPSYGTQMSIYFEWKKLERLLEEYTGPSVQLALEWFARQLMNMMICDTMAINESVWYAMAVNYFECGKDGFWLLPIFYDQLPSDQLDQLISSSASIDWEGKVATYRKIILDTTYHEALADALHASCNAYCYGAIHPAEGLAILQQLNISNAQYQSVLAALTTPIHLNIVDIVPLPIDTSSDIQCLIGIEPLQILPTWFPYGELWINDTYIEALDEAYLGTRWEDLAQQYGFALPRKGHRILGLRTRLEAHLLDSNALLKPVQHV